MVGLGQGLVILIGVGKLTDAAAGSDVPSAVAVWGACVTRFEHASGEGRGRGCGKEGKEGPKTVERSGRGGLNQAASSQPREAAVLCLLMPTEAASR